MKALLLASATARLCCAAATLGLAFPLALAAATPGRPALAQFEGRGFNDRSPREYDNRENNRTPSNRRDMRERDFNGRERPTRYEEPRRGDRQERQERQRPAITITPPGLSPFGRDRGPGYR